MIYGGRRVVGALGASLCYCSHLGMRDDGGHRMKSAVVDDDDNVP